MMKWLSRLVNWFWILTALLCVLAALTVTLGREFSPRISELSDDIELRLEKATGLKYTIAGLSADWQGLSPSLTFSNVAIGGNDQPTAISLTNGRAQLNIMRSIQTQTLVFDELKVAQFSLALAEEEQGGWSLLGVPKSSRGGANFKPIINSLIETHQLKAASGALVLHPNNEETIELRLNQFELLSDGFQRSIDISLTTSEGVQPIKVVGAAEGDPRDLSNFVARLYLSAQDQSHQGGRLWSLLGPMIGVDDTPEHFVNHRLLYTTNAWVSYDVTNKLQWVANFAIDDLPLPELFSDISVTDLDFSIAGQSTKMAQHSFSVPRLQFDLNDQPVELSSSWFQIDTREKGLLLNLAIENLQLNQLSPLTQVMSHEGTKQWLTGLNIGGSLQNLSASVPLSAGRANELSLMANVVNLSSDAYRSSPGLKGVTGFIKVDGLDGELQLNGAQLSQHYATLFADPIVAQQVSGRIAWHLDTKANRVFIGSEGISVNDPLLKAQGSFIAEAPINKLADSAYDPFLSLEIALQDVDASVIKNFTPIKSSSKLKDWLGAAFQGGKVTSGHVSIFGNSHKLKPLNRKVLLQGQVANMQLQFDPRWPAITNLDAFLVLDDAHISGRVKRGQFMGANLSGGEFNTLAADRERTTPRWLQISADAEAPLDSALSILRDTPLQKTFAKAVSGWQGQGELVTHMTLDVPMSGQQPAPRVKLDSIINADVLEMLEQRLTFTKVAGRIGYDDGMLTSNTVTANLFGKPYSAVFDNLNGTKNSLFLTFKGAASARQVARLIDQPWMAFVTGSTDLSGSFVVPRGASPYFTIDTDLHGVSIDLPEPLGKSASQLMPLSLSYQTQSKDISVDSDNLKALLVGSPLGYAEATFAIGSASQPELARGQYRAALQVPTADAVDWYDVYEQYSAILADGTESVTTEGVTTDGVNPDNASQGAPSSSPYWVVSGGTDQLLLGGVDLGPLGIQARLAADSSWASVEHHQFSGIVELHRNRLPRVDLAFLDTELFKGLEDSIETDSDQALANDTALAGSVDAPPQPADAGVQGDTIVVSTDLQPASLGYAQIPDLNISIGRLITGDDNLGSFRFELRNDGERLAFNQLIYSESVAGGLMSVEPGAMTWRYLGEQQTDLSLTLSMTDVGGVLARQSLPAVVNADSGRVEVDVSWPGGVNAFELNQLTGLASIDIVDGTFSSSSNSNDVLGLFNLFNFSYWADRAKIEAQTDSKVVGFSRTSGSFQFDQGDMSIADQIEVVGSGASFALNGNFDLIESQIDGTLVVTLPVGENVAWITALAAGLPAAAGVFVVSKLFKEQLAPLQSVTYSLTGSFDDPSMSFENLFKVDQKKPAN